MRMSPRHWRTERGDGRIAGDHSQIFHHGLGGQQPVEGIAVHKRKLPRAFGMSSFNMELPQLQLIHDHGKRRLQWLEAAELRFEGNLIGADRTDKATIGPLNHYRFRLRGQQRRVL